MVEAKLALFHAFTDGDDFAGLAELETHLGDLEFADDLAGVGIDQGVGIAGFLQYGSIGTRPAWFREIEFVGWWAEGREAFDAAVVE